MGTGRVDAGLDLRKGRRQACREMREMREKRHRCFARGVYLQRCMMFSRRFNGQRGESYQLVRPAFGVHHGLQQPREEKKRFFDLKSGTYMVVRRLWCL